MIILIRHGEAEGATGRAIGHTDLPLSRKGEIQAQQIAEAMAGNNFKTFLCSPLTRTMQTASYIKKTCSISPSPCPDFAEINLGKWDGLNYETIKKEFPEEYRKRGQDFSGYRPPEGESFLDLKKRVRNTFHKLAEDRQPVLIVTHAGVIRVLMHLVLDFPLENIFRIKPSHCYATVLLSTSKGYSLKAFNIPPGNDLKSLLAALMPQP